MTDKEYMQALSYRAEYERPDISENRKAELAWKLLRIKVKDNIIANQQGKQLNEYEIERVCEYLKTLMQLGASLDLIAVDILEHSSKVKEQEG